MPLRWKIAGPKSSCKESKIMAKSN